jgi:hypothetical protein
MNLKNTQQQTKAFLAKWTRPVDCRDVIWDFGAGHATLLLIFFLDDAPSALTDSQLKFKSN